MYHHYAQIDKNGYIVGISHLSGEMYKPNMIQIDEDFDPTNKKWNGASWESYTPPEPPEPEPTQLDRMEAQMNKTQDEIRQEGADSVMEELVKRGLIV
ncbi:flagellar basal-body rod protein [Anaerotignum sp.]|uniref:flagellar basal-body rod protein n=1 Tax=Anaerotignum sp. TaxID=2039241 RepID=UPI002A9142B5|nr:flagellar basal-body rod protein [Anaerotignum sp.]MCI7658391.1 flagellar basal-body rod protein [Clostridia bacterium]MDY5415666.1 flagellar basal-body rod protein [Anaerotignum sp.]